jgi:hypothetical protein
MQLLFTAEEVSEQFKVTVECLRKWRLLGKGPRYVKVGNRRFILSNIAMLVSGEIRRGNARWTTARIEVASYSARRASTGLTEAARCAGM